MKKVLLLLTVLAVNGIMNAQWVPQATGFEDAGIGMKDIQIFDANNVWSAGFVGSDSSIAYPNLTRTTNGGTTWTVVPIDNGFPEWTVDNLSAVNMNTAWIACTDLAGAVALGGVFKTTDGGVTWTRQLADAFSDPTSFLNTVQFVDENVGIAMGDPLTSDLEMYRTTDGGANWSSVPGNVLPDIITGEFGLNGGNVKVGNSIWLVTNKGKIYHTADAGVTWTKKNTPLVSFSQGAPLPVLGGEIFFKDANVGCLLNRTGSGATATYKIHTTTNAGTTWSAGVPCIYTSIAYVPGTNTMVGTKSNGSAYSNDNGTTWTVIGTAGMFEPVFLNATTGWASVLTVGATPPTTSGALKFTGTQLFTETFSNDNAFKASPNPTTGLVALTGKNITNVIVTDVLGKQVSNTNYTSLSNVNIDMTALNAGMYMVKVTNNEGNASTLKVVKQ
jgi:photosystem II stability/assembly factor-like uncharacterized protein